MDLHNLDVNSEYFKNLTSKEKYDLLTELKETRKQSSWGRLHEIPKKSDNFSDYQMQRLLKRRQVQVSLEETEKEMGGHYLSLNELEILLNEEGIDTKIESIPTRQIASDENTRFLLIKDVKEAIDRANKRETQNNTEKNVTDLGVEYDEDLESAIKLSLECTEQQQIPSSSNAKMVRDCSDSFTESSFISSDSEWETDPESDNENPLTQNFVKDNLAVVEAYMLENSGFTHREVKRIVARNRKRKKSKNVQRNSKIFCDNSENLDETAQFNDNIDSSSSVESRNESPDIADQESCDHQIANSSEPDIKQEDTNLLSENECDELSLAYGGENPKNSVNDKKQNNNSPIETNDFVNRDQTNPSVDSSITEGSQKMNVESSVSSDEESHNKVDVIECSDSDSDTSFEEVEDKTIDISGVEIDINIQNPPPDDIFADVFDDCLVKNKEKNIAEVEQTPNESKDVLVVDLAKQEIKLDDIESEASNAKNENLQTTNNIPSRVDAKVSEILKHPDSSVSQPKATEILIESSSSMIDTGLIDSSPKKGMTLNEIRYKTSQEDSDTKHQVESIENQPISTNELMAIADDLEKQKKTLERDQSKLDRMGRNISEEMTRDAQYLLKLFGVPYIIAPMEAEAQCAFLETIKLTDGTITDDSDIWLFGGKSVYKNFFNQQKYVLQFLSENINNCFKLSREHLILLALLVGSDYTTGLPGVGPVTAMEILSTFPFSNTDYKAPYSSLLQGLKKFRNWWSDNRAYGFGKLRSKLKNISVSQDFPNHKVVDAYLAPQVDTNSEAFSWGKPDVTALRDYAKQKFGWSQAKTDEILKPVLKRLDEKISQQSIRSFFRTGIKDIAAKENMSKRVRKAVENMENQKEYSEETMHESNQVTAEVCMSSQNIPLIEDQGTLPTNNSGSVKRKRNQTKISQKKSKPSTNCEPNIKKADETVIKLPEILTVKEAAEFARPFIPSREAIPQRELDKNVMIQNKLKAIEVFRTSKTGPGYIKKQGRKIRAPKPKAELSESESD